MERNNNSDGLSSTVPIVLPEVQSIKTSYRSHPNDSPVEILSAPEIIIDQTSEVIRPSLMQRILGNLALSHYIKIADKHDLARANRNYALSKNGGEEASRFIYKNWELKNKNMFSQQNGSARKGLHEAVVLGHISLREARIISKKTPLRIPKHLETKGQRKSRKDQSGLSRKLQKIERKYL